MTRSHLHLRARPGTRDELLRELDRLELLVAARDQPGLLGIELLVSEDDPDLVLVDASWSSVEHYERWRSSAAATALVSALEPRLADAPAAAAYRLADTIS